jgi:hypothetical protein
VLNAIYSTYEVCVLDLELKLWDRKWGLGEEIRG